MRKILFKCLLLAILILSGGCNITLVQSATVTPTAITVPSSTPTIPPTQTEIPTQTATPWVDYSHAFFDPQSEADFPKVIESPSPLDDPVGFAKWQDGYLAAVDKFLVDYTGPFIESDTNSGYDYQRGMYEFIKLINARPITSYRFPWISPDGTSKTIITKTYPIRDKTTGVKGSFSLTYSVDGGFSYAIAGQGFVGEYVTATFKAPISFWITSGAALKDNKDAQFEQKFLPADGSKVLVMLANFSQGKGIDPILNKQRLVFGGYK